MSVTFNFAIEHGSALDVLEAEAKRIVEQFVGHPLDGPGVHGVRYTLHASPTTTINSGQGDSRITDWRAEVHGEVLP